MIPEKGTLYPPQPTENPYLGGSQYEEIHHPNISRIAPPQIGFQNGACQPLPTTNQPPLHQFQQNVPEMKNPNEPPPPYAPQVISPIPHPTPVAIQMPMIQQMANPNIVVNNGNENMGGGGINSQNPEQVAALINLKIVKCPFCGMGTLKKSIKYRQMIIFCLITVFFFPFGLLIWCCLCCNNLHKRTCTNCSVEA